MQSNNDVESILNSIKKLLGLAMDYNPFDADIIIHINTVFSNLVQMGVGPEKGFEIYDSSTKWSDITDDDITINNIKSYVYLKVKLLFDPPANGVLVEAINNQIKEIEYRLYTQKGGF